MAAMFQDRFVKVMLVLIALLLAANLVKENVTVKPVFAAPAESGGTPPAAISGGGTTTWIVIGNQLFYAKVDNYNRIEIFGPERLKY
jgi:hypothetical protein